MTSTQVGKDAHGHDHDHSRRIDYGRTSPSGPAREDASRFAFKIHGMDCAEEVDVLRRELGPLVGGEKQLAFDVLNGKMIVTDGAAPVSADAIRAAVARTGMRAEEWQPSARQEPATDRRQRQIQVVLTAASGFFVGLGVAIHAWIHGGLVDAFGVASQIGAHAIPLPAIVAYALAIAAGGRYVVVKAWHAARRLRPDMNLLMTVAVIGAIAIGEWFEAATVAFLFALSLALERWSVGRARRAIAALLDLTPPVARLIGTDGSETVVPAADVEVGAVFIVKPGERIPLDGRVTSGTSAVNQAPITGESMPVAKQQGADVFAGTINGDGALQVETTRRADDTTLAHIIKLVESAQSRRTHIEQWVDRFARIYTPIVMALAIAIAVIPPIAVDGSWTEWFYRALVLLVIACPCALVISTPVSIVAALACSARAGVLVKGGEYLEVAARLQAVAMDKTGTLTEGRPVVLELQPLNGHTEAELLQRAAALEALSGHPLARAIMDFAKLRGVDVTPAEDVQISPGKGVTGRVQGRAFWLGSHRYLEERGQETRDVHERAVAHQRQGRTVVVIGNDTHICGLVLVADTVRRNAAASVAAMRDAGIRHVIMLTGDNRETGESIARETGVDEVRAELLPADKVAAIEALVAKYGAVAMIGDGVNDAPAMAVATLGIAMGVGGSDAAIEAADIALMSDDLSKVPWLVKHSRRTVAVIRQNIAFSLLVKATFVILTFAGLASLWGAIAADVGASLLVVANGLRLLRPLGLTAPANAEPRHPQGLTASG